MLFSLLLYVFGLGYPPSGIEDTDAWDGFLSTIDGGSGIVCLIFLALILTAYGVSAHKFAMNTPGDLFSSFSPLRWLYLSLASGIVALGLYIWVFILRFGPLDMVFLGGAFLQMVWITFLTWLFAYAAIAMPLLSKAYFKITFRWVTPPRFRYRPVKRLLK